MKGPQHSLLWKLRARSDSEPLFESDVAKRMTASNPKILDNKCWGPLNHRRLSLAKGTQSLAIWQVLGYWLSRFETVVISNLNRTVPRIPFFEIMELGGTYKCPFQLWLGSSFKSGRHKLLSGKFCRKLEFSWTESNHSCLVPDLQEWVPGPSAHLEAKFREI